MLITRQAVKLKEEENRRVAEEDAKIEAFAARKVRLKNDTRASHMHHVPLKANV